MYGSYMNRIIIQKTQLCENTNFNVKYRPNIVFIYIFSTFVYHAHACVYNIYTNTYARTPKVFSKIICKLWHNISKTETRKGIKRLFIIKAYES